MPVLGQAASPRVSAVFNPDKVSAPWQQRMREIGNWAASTTIEGAGRYAFLRNIDPASPNPEQLAAVSPFVQALVREWKTPHDVASIPSAVEEQRKFIAELDAAADSGGAEAIKALQKMKPNHAWRAEDPDQALLKLREEARLFARRFQQLDDSGLYAAALVAAPLLREASVQAGQLERKISERLLLRAEAEASRLTAVVPTDGPIAASATIPEAALEPSRRRTTVPLEKRMLEVESEIILAALRYTEGNIRAAAVLLLDRQDDLEKRIDALGLKAQARSIAAGRSRRSQAEVVDFSVSKSRVARAEQLEEEILRQVLWQTRGDSMKAAASLKISRMKLYARIQKYGLGYLLQPEAPAKDKK